MAGIPQISTLYTGRVLLDRVQTNIIAPMNAILRSIPQVIHFQFVEVAGVSGAAPTYSLQFAGSSGIWVTLDTFDSLGNLTANGCALSGGAVSLATDGGKAQAGQLFMGSGAPANANGNDGDAYLRTDTPGTANQRLYTRSAGTWSGVL